MSAVWFLWIIRRERKMVEEKQYQLGSYESVFVTERSLQRKIEDLMALNRTSYREYVSGEDIPLKRSYAW